MTMSPPIFAARTTSLALVAFCCFGCGGGFAHADALSIGDTDTGLAAYYSDRLDGRTTASGEPYDKTTFTAAHRDLPFGTIVLVTNLENRKSVRVRINDRGPHGDGKRIIDLSRAAAERIDMIHSGVVKVRIEIVETAR